MILRGEMQTASEIKEAKRLVKSLRKDYSFKRHRPTVTVSRGDYEQLLKLAEQAIKQTKP